MASKYFSDRIDIHTRIRFADIARNNGVNKIDNAFQFIEDNKLAKSISPELMQKQRERLMRVGKAAQS